MNKFKTEYIVLIGMAILYIVLQAFSFNIDRRVEQRSEDCFSDAKDDRTARQVCSQISSSSYITAISAKMSLYPIIILIFGLIIVYAIKIRRLQAEVKELQKNR